MLKAEELKLVTEWDKTFAKSEKVEHRKVTFVNRYGITLAADLYVPKNAAGKLPGRLPTLTPKIFRQPLISFPYRTMWMQKK